MLSKLIKYDLKSVSPVLLTIHGAVLILSLLGHFFMSLLHIKPFDTIFSSIYTVTLLTAIGAVALATIVYLGMRYHRNLYTDEGYLTNTLPVTANCHVLSKYLCGVLWSFLDAAVILLCVFIFLNDELFEFCQAVSAYIPANLFLLTIATVILELFISCLSVYCAVGIGNLFHGHRVMGCIGGYVLLYLINQVIGLILAFPFFTNETIRNAESADANSPEVLYEVSQILGRILILSLILSIIIGIIYYIVCVKLLDKKLEMD